MALDLDKIEGLTPEQITSINAQHEDDVKGLKDNNSALLDEKAKGREARAKAESDAEEARLLAAQKSGDVESVTTSFQAKLDAANAEITTMKTDAEKRDAANTETLLEAEALKLANQLAEGHNVDIMARYVKDRLRAEDGKVKVTDADGNLVMNTTDELLTEMRSDKRFAALVVASKASGSGANGDNGSGNPGGSTNTDTQYLVSKVPALANLPVK